MSLIGLRDMSVIETPPRDRMAIQTVVAKFDEKLIRSAIEVELERGGQVYFVHNRVETIYELANQVVGNAVSALNDQGFHFRVHPPLLLTSVEGDKTSEDVEALMICFETSLGNVFMNVALRYNKRRMSDHAAAAGAR